MYKGVKKGFIPIVTSYMLALELQRHDSKRLCSLYDAEQPRRQKLFGVCVGWAALLKWMRCHRGRWRADLQPTSQLTTKKLILLVFMCMCSSTVGKSSISSFRSQRCFHTSGDKKLLFCLWGTFEKVERLNWTTNYLTTGLGLIYCWSKT